MLHAALLAVLSLAAPVAHKQVTRAQTNDVASHQVLTQRYREALEELRKNPRLADIPDCKPDNAVEPCLAQPEPRKEKPGGIDRRIALVIGNNDYSGSIPRLQTAIADAGQIGQVLQNRYDYDVRILSNAGKAQIVGAINAIAASARPNDSVLVFYAGRGYLSDDPKMGYWLPIDASTKSPLNWLSNSDINKLLRTIPARQVILISDSCFSANLIKVGEKAPEGAAKQHTVVALSSGGEEPDEGKNGHSAFALNLIKALDAKEPAGLSGQQIWRSVHDAMPQEAKQEPQYGAVSAAGHIAGNDFVFVPAP